MTKNAAQALVDINRYLEGTRYQGKIISHLYIVPVPTDGFSKFIEAIKNNNGAVSEYINLEYDDFNVIAVFDLENYHLTNRLEWVSLEYLMTH